VRLITINKTRGIRAVIVNKTIWLLQLLGMSGVRLGLLDY
jgi:hypothetical protein